VSQAEIDAASQIHLPQFNAQAPTKIVYPPTFITAKAYVAQLVRSNALTAAKGTELTTAMDKKNTKALKTFAASLDKDAATANPIDKMRMTALAEILKQS